MNTSLDERMIGRLKRAGVNLQIAMHGDFEAIRKEVRRRCKTCENEDLCERWLAEKVIKGGNSFCPNARLFRNLARKTGPTD